MENGFRSIPNLQPGYSTGEDPVENFYIPVLSCSKYLDRSAGFFTSSSLSVAARGLARFIANGGRMRLLVGSELREADVAAIEQGASLTDVTRERLMALFEEPRNDIEQQRLEALAWMVSVGTLEIRVVVPRKGQGYFHVKHGIATDGHGERIAWEGSNNETRAGWVTNYEQFLVSPSWESGWTAQQVKIIEDSFQRLWDDQHLEWRTVPIPDAAREKLLTYKPAQAPVSDPEEKDRVAVDREAVVAWWLRDVPHLLGVEGQIGGTAAIQPWPHQSRVADDVVAKFPERFLLADEVGLGKTIEVGLILRDLLVSETVRKCLILAPASVLVQWQGELREKFGIGVPIYDGHQLLDPGPDQRVRSLSYPTQWTEEPLVLMSSQLAKRTERRGEILDGPEWDMVVVDEAHHARRKDYQDRNRRRPNRLLELLEGIGGQPGLAGKTRGLLLLTATPMQVHPVEVWDLLTQLGLPGKWGAHESYFLRYFEELRNALTGWEDVNWRLIADMAREERHYGGAIHENLSNRLQQQVGWVGWDRVQKCLDNPHRIKNLQNRKECRALLEVFEHLTPLRRRMHRSTRELLRAYQKQGLLPERLSDRRPEPRWVTMTAEEKALYDRVEEYISEFYNKYEQKRRGLGFVMTVYRRRLTSSFYALERSLQRRFDFLHGHQETDMTPEDLEEDDLNMDIAETLEDNPDEMREIFAEEIQYVEDFLQKLRNLGTDTKYAQLVKDLSRALEQRDKVVIFTQFTDTMDYLRDLLRGTYGHRIACYSGRGGERWTGNEWERVGKEEIKRAFRKGEVQILLGNDAMAEGLNLQTCGVEINYDVPWNPMRLEQRIGRVDRIGQKYDTVWIWSYFLEDTIEAEVYRRLMDRIDWFQYVIGSLQPILHQVEKTIRKLALEPGQTRHGEMAKALTSITTAITQTEQEGIEFDRHLTQSPPPVEQPPPATTEELEQFFVTSPRLGRRFTSHPSITDAYQVTLQNKQHLVTFSTEAANERSDSLRLLTFGDALFEELLDEVTPPTATSFGLVRVETRPEDRLRVGWYQTLNGEPVPITLLSELIEALKVKTNGSEHVEQSQQRFTAQIGKETDRQRKRRKNIADEKQSLFMAQGQHLLTQAAYNWTAQRRSLFDKQRTPIGPATLDAMSKTEGHPWAPLRLLVKDVHLSPDSQDWQSNVTTTDSQLKRRWRSLEEKAAQLLPRLAEKRRPTDPHPPINTTTIQTTLL